MSKFLKFIGLILLIASCNSTSFGKENIPTQLPLQIEIIDFGTGIPSNLLSSIFDPFVSTEFGPCRRN